MQSSFAFYRGSAALMAADLASTPKSGLMVQACGDAHLMNFGGFATPERNIIFDINDLDETLPAPWEWDLKRLVASVVIAGVISGCPRARPRGRRSAPPVPTGSTWPIMDPCGLWTSGTTRSASSGCSRKWREKRIVGVSPSGSKKRGQKAPLTTSSPSSPRTQGMVPRILDNPPLIFHPTAEQAPGLETGYSEAFAIYRESLPEHVRTLFDRFTFCDLAVKVVGVGSVGTICEIALFLAADDDPIFLQIKEATASVLEPYAGKSLHENHGQRVVAGQRLMQVGKRHIPGMDAGPRRPPLLHPPAPRREDQRGRRRLRSGSAASLRATVRVGLGAGACPVGRPRDDRGLHGCECYLR